MLGNLYRMGPEACPALSLVKQVPDLVLGIGAARLASARNASPIYASYQSA